MLNTQESARLESVDDIISMLNFQQSTLYKPKAQVLVQAGSFTQQNTAQSEEIDSLTLFCSNNSNSFQVAKNQNQKENQGENSIQQGTLRQHHNAAEFRRLRYLSFKPWSGVAKRDLQDTGYYYKFQNSAVKLIKGLLEENGFTETEDKDWSIMWVNGAVRADLYQGLMAYQKINHFPKSFEITRKDLMHRNISKMQSRFGAANFGFIPKTYILPAETQVFLDDAERNRGQWWIVKPHANSQGRGIVVTDRVQDVLKKQQNHQTIVVSHYISNPLLIDDLKFDLRIYVAVTSIHPLRIYIYQDGLARFATQSYNVDGDQQKNKFVHLTNYSVNKNSSNFVENTDALDDATGTKWSLAALKDFFKLHGLNANLLFERIEDLCIKTILSIEGQVYYAFEHAVPYRNNCFEVLGFDILIDSALKPWLLEVNLSPSMNTDSPLDLKIKGNMIADLFTLVGLVPNDLRYAQDHSFAFNQNSVLNEKQNQNLIQNISDWPKHRNELSKMERHIIRESDEELKRTRNFKRIFPTENAFKYKNYFDIERPYNLLLRNHEIDKFKNANAQASQQNHKVPAVSSKAATVLQNQSFTGQNNQQPLNQTAYNINIQQNDVSKQHHTRNNSRNVQRLQEYQQYQQAYQVQQTLQTLQTQSRNNL